VDEQDWVQIAQGWARGIVPAGPRTFSSERPGGTFRAVLFPTAASGELTLAAGSTTTTERIDEPRSIEWLLPPGNDRFELTASDLVIHDARIVYENTPARRVLFILVDTLRADHATREHMPEVWDYFADGVRFTQAFSAATWTLPSVASIFTGKPPIRMRIPDGSLISIAPQETTLAESMAQQGYRTVAVVANYTVNHENGFSSGFELFWAPTELENGHFPDADWVLEKAGSALEWAADEDLFLYLHLMEPHGPYRNHETGEAFWPPSSPSQLAAIDAAQVAEMRAAYASEVRYASRRIGEFLQRHGPFDLVVLTADHGEEFFEHGGFVHGLTVYREVSNVPLFVRSPQLRPRQITSPVSLVDLKSFLLDVDDRLLPADRPVMTETFTHAPPRWSRLADGKQAILFARSLQPGPRLDDIGEWLLESHPPIALLGDQPDALLRDERLAADTVLSLAGYLRGFRAGLFVLLPRGQRADLAITGVSAEGWLWGEAERFEATADETGSVRLVVEDPLPFALLFLPAAEGSIVVTDLTSGQVIDTAEGPPTEMPAAGLRAWLDAGRPAAEIQSAEETLKRLRALGYIGGGP